MALKDVMRCFGAVGDVPAAPVPLPFIGSAEAKLLCFDLRASAEDLARFRMRAAALARECRAKRPKKPRPMNSDRGVRTLAGEIMPHGWIGKKLLSLLCESMSTTADLAKKIEVDKPYVERALSFLLSKKHVEWEIAALRYKPRMWHITQAGRDWLEAHSL